MKKLLSIGLALHVVACVGLTFNGTMEIAYQLLFVGCSLCAAAGLYLLISKVQKA